MNVYQGVLPDDLVGLLIKHLQDSKKRKIEYDLLSKETPSCILAASEVLQNKVQSNFNTAIIKKYDLNDVYRSTAYKPHRDPSVFKGHPLVFCSLSGQAELSIETDRISTVNCQKGTVIVLHNNETHWVTPPQNKDGVRYFLFLGFKD